MRLETPPAQGKADPGLRTPETPLDIAVRSDAEAQTLREPAALVQSADDTDARRAITGGS